ncbi:threonine synthase [Coemansia erecta]|uniref:threonine synthase n=1 Tax=Coemansia asiatica TaxID=1052880 RepID=A0A9W7XQ22_9FUNG|nr:threonine synthase [Coemansia asiatica]KAJ2855287.1 threonine synthase [Coemansia erecta]KAJ2878991.1 threonine synthase [Coemansia asiatica]
MKYRSTRGQVAGQSFESVVLEGLASDGGLYIPEQLPSLPSDWQTRWATLSFAKLAAELITLFVGSDLTPSEVEQLTERSYATFDTPSVTPLVDLDPSSNTHILELFHGPTFAFKDVALQFLGNLFEFFLERKNAREGQVDKYKITVVGATSGDTGSAAIYGLRGKKNVSVFILHPKGRVSPIQEAQMTTVLDSNVHNVSIEGTFDDCQDIVKQLFGRADFKQEHSLGAVNSINWARILAQITYYFYAYFTLMREKGKDAVPVFVVPSGNFGDILAGYYAKSLGLPVGRLAIATNANDILDRFLDSGVYEKNAEKGVLATPSPAMDILVSSNFERFLWYLARDHEISSESSETVEAQASEIIRQWMDQLKTTGSFSVTNAALDAARQVFWSGRCSNEDTYKTIAKYYGREQPYLLDPHTAVGVHVAEKLRPQINALCENSGKVHTICLSTAHPAKFSEAVLKAVNENGQNLDFQSILPAPFIGLLEQPRRCLSCDNSADAVAQLIVENIN